MYFPYSDGGGGPRSTVLGQLTRPFPTARKALSDTEGSRVSFVLCVSVSVCGKLELDSLVANVVCFGWQSVMAYHYYNFLSVNW